MIPEATSLPKQLVEYYQGVKHAFKESQLVKWTYAVEEAIIRQCKAKNSAYFTRQELIRKELDQIVADTASKRASSAQTLSRILQDLRDAGEIEFVKRGVYRKIWWPI